MTLSLVLVLGANAFARYLTERYPVGEVLVFRFIGALPIVLAFAARAGVAPFPRRRRAMHAARTACGFAGMAALYAASRHLPFSDLIGIAYSSPILVAALAHPLLGERVSLRRFLLIIGGFLGVLLIAFPGRLELWSLGALAMAGFNALSMIGARSLGRTESTVSIACQFALSGTLFSLPLLALGCRLPDVSDLPAVAALGACAGFAIQLYASAFRHAPAAVLAPIDYLAIFLSTAIGFLVWSEVPTLPMLLGGAILVTCGLLQLRAAESEAGAQHVAGQDGEGRQVADEAILPAQ